MPKSAFVFPIVIDLSFVSYMIFLFLTNGFSLIHRVPVHYILLCFQKKNFGKCEIEILNVAVHACCIVKLYRALSNARSERTHPQNRAVATWSWQQLVWVLLFEYADAIIPLLCHTTYFSLYILSIIHHQCTAIPTLVEASWCVKSDGLNTLHYCFGVQHIIIGSRYHCIHGNKH